MAFQREVSMRVTLLALLAGAAFAGDKPQGHPHFNDGGTLRWYTELAKAQAVAKKEGKLIFIEYGREA
jgi:hypothetical protein